MFYNIAMLQAVASSRFLESIVSIYIRHLLGKTASCLSSPGKYDLLIQQKSLTIPLLFKINLSDDLFVKCVWNGLIFAHENNILSDNFEMLLFKPNFHFESHVMGPWSVVLARSNNMLRLDSPIPMLAISRVSGFWLVSVAGRDV